MMVLGMAALGDVLDLQMSPSISNGEGKRERGGKLIFEGEGEWGGGGLINVTVRARCYLAKKSRRHENEPGGI